MKVFITGIRGFLGAALARYLREQGDDVCGSTHRVPDEEAPGLRHWPVGEPPDPGWFRGCDAVVHCAYDAAPGAYQRNLDLSLAAFAAAQAAGVPYQLFISSHSARPDAQGDYGRHKHALESEFLARGQGVARPGLILGAGGLYATLRRQLLSAPLLVLPAPARLPVFAIGLDDLLLALRAMLGEQCREACNLYLAPPPSLGDFARAVLRAAGRERFILPLPWPLLAATLAITDRTFSNPPPALARLYAARQNLREPDYHRSDLARFSRAPLPLAAALDRAQLTLAGQTGRGGSGFQGAGE